MATYIVKPVDGSPEFTVEAEHYSYDQTSGRHIFRSEAPTDAVPDPTIVANLLNVSVRLDQTA